MGKIHRTCGLATATLGALLCVAGCEPGSAQQSSEPTQTRSESAASPVAEQMQGTEKIGLERGNRRFKQRKCRWYSKMEHREKVVSATCPGGNRVVTGGCRTQWSFIGRSAPFVDGVNKAPKDGTHWSSVAGRRVNTGWTCARPDAIAGELQAMALCCEY